MQWNVVLLSEHLRFLWSQRRKIEICAQMSSFLISFIVFLWCLNHVVLMSSFTHIQTCKEHSLAKNDFILFGISDFIITLPSSNLWCLLVSPDRLLKNYISLCFIKAMAGSLCQTRNFMTLWRFPKACKILFILYGGEPEHPNSKTVFHEFLPVTNVKDLSSKIAWQVKTLVD